MATKVAAAGPVEGPWALPDGWRWSRLGDLGEFLNGAAFKPTDWGDVGTPIIRIQNLNNPERPMNRTTRTINERLLVRAGDLLVSWSATLDAFLWRREDAWLNQHIFKVVPNEELVDRRYMFFLLKNEIENLKKTEHLHGSTMMHINRGPFLAHPVPVPPLETQVRVAARIDELFAEIDDGEAALARARDDLATWRKALLKAAVTGELTADWRSANPPSESGIEHLANLILKKQASNRAKKSTQSDVEFREGDLPAIPLEWAWSTVGQIAHVTGGITKNAKRDALPLRLPYLRVGNVYAGRVDLTRMEAIGVSEVEAERSAVKDGDLLIVEGNGSIDQIGRSAIWGGQIDPCLHQNHLIKVRFSDRRIAEWIQVWLQSPWGRKELEAQASSTSGLHTLSISKVAGLRCPVPPLRELDVSLSMVQRLTAEATAGGDDMNTMKSTAATLRQSILAAAFRGELA